MRRRCAAVLAALFGLALAGCGDTSAIRGGGNVAGRTLVVYTVLPLTGPLGASSRDMVDGAKLALAEAGGKAGRFTVTFAALDETGAPAEAARAAIRDLQTVAVIGAGTSRSGRVMVPLLDAAGVALVSPGATQTNLTSDARFHPSGATTFGRIVGTDADQVRQMLDTADGRVAIEHDGSETGRQMSDEAERQLAELGREPSDSRRATLLYFGEDLATAAEVLNGDLPGGALVPDQLARRGLASQLTGRARETVGLMYAAPSLRMVPEPFVESFRERFGREPGRYTVLGYEAMRTVLGAIDRAGKRGSSRRAVVRQLLSRRLGSPRYHLNTAADDLSR
jgi:branched-chain amino acid transport system substrate-binding protein